MPEVARLNIVRNPESRPRNEARLLPIYPNVGPVEMLFQGSPAMVPVYVDARILAEEAARFQNDNAFVASSARLPQALRNFELWLTAKADALDLPHLGAQVIELAQGVTGTASIATAQAALDALVADPTWMVLRRRVADSLTAAALSSVAVVTRQFLVRTMLVMGLIDYLQRNQAAIAADPSPPEAIKRLLQRTPVLPSPPFPLAPASVTGDVPGDFKAVLARAPRVGDMFVVRSEWACYQAGEIAHIENVLKGETKKHTLTQTDQTTVTTETETTQHTLQSRDNESTDRFELSQSASDQTHMQLAVDGHVDLAGTVGGFKIETYLGAGFNYSKDQANATATNTMHETITKSVTSIEQTVRDLRRQVTTTRTVEYDEHDLKAVDNNIVGIYRWVDKIERLAQFRYTDRLIVEFEVPEPGAYLRWLVKRGLDSGLTTPEPNPFTCDRTPEGPPLLPCHISENPGDLNYWMKLTGEWAALGVEPPPDKEVVVSGALIKPADPNPQDVKNPVNIWQSPEKPQGAGGAAGSVDGQSVVVPDGYQAYAGDSDKPSQDPAWRGWIFSWDLRSHPKPGWQGDLTAPYILWPTLRVTVGSSPGASGAYNAANEPALYALLSDNTKWTDTMSVVSAHRDATARNLYGVFDQNAARTGTLPITVMASNHDMVQVFVEVRCKRTEDGFAKWQRDTHDKLQAAYYELKQAHDREAAQRKIDQGVQIDGASPLENQRQVREELKRQVVQMMLDEQDFAGKNAITTFDPNDPSTRPSMSLSQAAEVTEIIQFIEQAFEWQLMTYIAYPYFWADASHWEDLLSTTSTDPDYASFLRAGSARVVVPSRKGKAYQDLVMAFLATGKLWGGGPAPTAGQDLYVSVAQEIQDTTGAPDDGEWMFSWEVRLPTTLIWLDPNAGAQLPITNTSSALTAPAPDKQLCKILPMPGPGKGTAT